MNLQDRIDNYHRVTRFPKSLWLGGDGRIAGIFIMGNDYRVKSQFYGGYPAGYLKRIKALFPETHWATTLHLFSGKVDTKVFPGCTVDLNPDNEPDKVADAHTLPKLYLKQFHHILADPPYSVEDCEHYGTPMVNRNTVLRTLGDKCRKGAFLIWLDQVLPMYRKSDWNVVGHIGMVKSTNHRFRVITIFQHK